ncbi:hypothetical protein SRABI112_01175 [Pseudomonas mediterranea]|jgi:hypothetical protein|uniref:Uncharacterized protein n=1 Tax=Pseudomonas mediterranea TaxID=183795 RepID=A0AAX2DH44_9PSED|nr:hypothetical protein N005_25900 [Pseudomonas mediterranea CFBP 5447]CAH0171179.1 hypothetical protein SRABI112_01175 [Pseudomonas mediterranea]SDU69638.1 hypothetical protein SAMN05216476_4429 [Pseudomonas mediterranea]
MSKADVEHSTGMMSTSASLNRDLLKQLEALNQAEHTSSECWSSGASLVREASLWILFGAALWVGTLLAVGANA